ncbi:MAG: Rrf2 family transcriptional regulator [Anaerolineales bacterium]|nr:Rrf2 family transcriptional regulator [Anaerolineales bacterium]
MGISSRFAVAIHILALLEQFKDEHTTSAFIAGSVNTNPVVIRRILGMLVKAGLVEVKAGVGGASLIKPLTDISLFDIYEAVSSIGEGDLFSVHEQSNPLCPVGGNIQIVLENTLGKIQQTMELALKSVNMDDIMKDIRFQKEKKQ